MRAKFRQLILASFVALISASVILPAQGDAPNAVVSR